MNRSVISSFPTSEACPSHQHNNMTDLCVQCCTASMIVFKVIVLQKNDSDNFQFPENTDVGVVLFTSQ